MIRRFSEISNETAGEHFTPREVIRLIVELLLANDHAALTGTGIIRTVYDPACGTGGMLALTEEAMTALNPKIRVELFGQELNGEFFGICKSDMLVTGHNPEQIAFGNTLTDDAHPGKTFHYMLSNPPYGVDWKKYQDPIRAEHETKGFDGRFGPGLPRISDGQLLFLLHMISKMRDDEQGSRIGIVRTARRFSPAGLVRAKAISAGGCWKKTGLKPSSPCRPRILENLRSGGFRLPRNPRRTAFAPVLSRNAGAIGSLKV